MKDMSNRDELSKIADAMEQYRVIDWKKMPDIDLYMDQVITYLRQHLEFFHDAPDDNLITHSIINNYVKGGVVERPVKKKYTKAHLAQLIMACLLKRVMPIGVVKKMICSGTPPEESFYAAFCAMQEKVLSEEADSFRAQLSQLNNREDALKMATRFALRANADRLIADRILEAAATWSEADTATDA